ncbi:GNAT family N-acetyltransferase [Kitasatospora sp. NPDC001574]
MSAPSQRPEARRATFLDAPELLRLRLITQPATGSVGHWPERFLDTMRRTLGNAEADPYSVTGDFIGYVTEHRDGRLSACALAVLYKGYPGPDTPDGNWARIDTVAVDPARHRPGLTSACIRALCADLADHGYRRIELAGAPGRQPLYNALGFTQQPAHHVRTPLNAPRTPSPGKRRTTT